MVRLVFHLPVGEAKDGQAGGDMCLVTQPVPGLR
jgi:hypothetical protein